MTKKNIRELKIVKIGCCGDIEEREMLEKKGFDFIECPVAVPMNLKESELKEIIQDEDLNLPFYAFNCFIPGNLKICGDKVDFSALEDYVEEACQKINLLGGKIIVFGSGGARRVPEGFSSKKAWNQIKDFLTMVNKYARKNDITIAIEPLNQDETNILNSLKESIKMAEEVNLEKIKVLVDIYRLEKENES